MSPLRHRQSQSEVPTQPDYLEAFLAEPAEVGSSDADVEAVEKDDAVRAADHVRNAEYLKTEEAFDRNAPRPSVRDTP